jgi:ribonucleoside-diphosphate reductase alpha chain
MTVDTEDVVMTDAASNPRLLKLLRLMEQLATNPKLAPLHPSVDLQKVYQDIEKGFVPSMTAQQLKVFAAETACYMATIHPDYSFLAARIAVAALHEVTSPSFSATIRKLYAYRNPKTGDDAPLVSKELHEFVESHKEELDQYVDYNRDFRYDYFGYKTLERSYLLRMEDEEGQLKVVERPQHMLMRVALGLWCAHPNGSLKNALETYENLSLGTFTHASPTLFNAGTPHPQLSSCFLLAMKGDSLDGIFDTIKDTAMISKGAGGLGVHIHNIRATGSYIRGTNGQSNGIVPMLRVFDTMVRYVDQGGGKRKGACTIYLEPWHPDVFDFLQLRKNHGKDEQRARDLFQALWIPDLFMKRLEQYFAEVEKGQAGNPDSITWSLFCPNEAPGLPDVWGEKFEALYTQYEAQGKARKKVPVRELWDAILTAQIETGGPFMLYKDHANRKSNQQNLGTIKCSNLCTEIIEYTSPEETAVCNLASISLTYFVKTDNAGRPYFDFQGLHQTARLAARNLNRVIDVTEYPTNEARNSNFRHRPMGVGVQGLADTFCKMEMAFTSQEARELNKHIFETIYHGAMEMSCEIAKELGTYESYVGSPASQGTLQHDMWGVKATAPHLDWDTLRSNIKAHGLRNSLFLAPMPTASTSQILGNNECFEPYTTNSYVRRVLSGEFPVINKHLVAELSKLNLWTDDVRERIVAHDGSVQSIGEIPQAIKERYRTVWEIAQKDLLEMHIDRCAFIDQSASLNVFMARPNKNRLSLMHRFGWKGGLKTGMYYLRTQPAADAIKFTVKVEALQAASDVKTAAEAQKKEEAPLFCTREMMEAGCVSCGS